MKHPFSVFNLYSLFVKFILQLISIQLFLSSIISLIKRILSSVMHKIRFLGTPLKNLVFKL